MAPVARNRWSVASRALAAIVGGYVLTNLVTLTLSLLPSLTGAAVASSLLGATMASFLIWTAIVMAVFHARTAVRAWGWLTGIALPLAWAVCLLLPGAGRW